MGKIGGSSLLNAFKRVLKSPIKGSEQRRSEQQEDDHKQNRRKRKWIFRKASPYERTIQHKEAKNITIPCSPRISTSSTDQGKSRIKLPFFEAEEKRAIAVAMATKAAAEAAVATAHAAVEVIRLTTPSIFVDEYYAALKIQTAFRGYLARRALKALKGVVKLQACIRGYNVRKRAEKTLHCMQSLLRVQNQVCDQRKRLSTESKFSPLKHFYQVAEMKSNSRSHTGNTVADEDSPKSMKEDYRKGENSLAYAFSRQMWRSDIPKYQEEKTDPRDTFKTVEIDTSSLYPSPNFLDKQTQHFKEKQQQRYSVSSPQQTHRKDRTRTRNNNLLVNSLTSPSRSRIRTITRPNTPSPRRDDIHKAEAAAPQTPTWQFPGSPMLPSYMAATESAVSRFRSKSAPRQRESGCSSAKKRLSFAVF